MRCSCGNLLACLTPRGVEVKCRRCKRVVQVFVLPAQPDDTAGGGRDPPDG